jgi:hypothetical protein
MVDFRIDAPNAALAGLAGFNNAQQMALDRNVTEQNMRLAAERDRRAEVTFGQQNALFEQGQQDRLKEEQAASVLAAREAAAQAELGILQKKVLDGTFTPQDLMTFSVRYPELSGDMINIQKALDEVATAKKEEDRANQAKLDLKNLGEKVSAGTATAQDFAAFNFEYPEMADDLKSTWEGLAEDRKNTDSQMAMKAGIAIKSGRPDIAVKMFGDYASAAENSGNKQDADLARAMAETIKEDPEAGLTTIGFMLQSIDPDANMSLFGGELDMEAGLTPIYGRDDRGNLVVMQPTKGGSLVRSNLPEGVTVDPSIGAEEKARGAAVGKASGEALAAIPGAQLAVTIMDGQIDALIADPYLDNMLGPFDSRKPNVSGAASRVQSKMDQLRGQAFLQAFQLLKGGGQITQIEGEKATQALIRLADAQNRDDYVKALEDFRTNVKLGLEKLAKAGAVTASDAPQAAGAGSNVMNFDADGNLIE